MANNNDRMPRCSFCGKTEAEANRMLFGNGAYICDDCVSLCYSMLFDDDGLTDYRHQAAARRKKKNTAKVPLMKPKEIKEMSITVPAWMTVDVEKLEGKVVAMPRREEIDTPIAEHLIVELYSK